MLNEGSGNTDKCHNWSLQKSTQGYVNKGDICKKQLQIHSGKFSYQADGY